MCNKAGNNCYKMQLLIRYVAVSTILTWPCYSNGPGENSAGVLAGHVQNEDGRPLSNIDVVVHLNSVAGGRPFSASSRTIEDGSFSISRLPKGRYQVCVHDRKRGYLDPCQWANSPPSVDISSTRTSQVPAITLKKGRLLQVRIVDDTGATTRTKDGPSILVGVWRDNGLFVTVPLKTSDSKSRLHAQYVPDDKPLLLSLASSSYVITNEQGVSADTGKGMRKQVDFPPGDQPITIMLHIMERAK